MTRLVILTKYLKILINLVGPMLSALKADKSVRSYWPRYCAHIDFEFMSNEQGEQFVRVLYDEVPIVIGGEFFIYFF